MPVSREPFLSGWGTGNMMEHPGRSSLPNQRQCHYEQTNRRDAQQRQRTYPVRLVRRTSTSALVWCASMLLLSSSLLSRPTVATKHTFVTTQDARSVIGPIGTPYGFLNGGVYNLTVFDFELTVGHRRRKKSQRKKRKKDGEDDGQEEALEFYEAGFLLKKFESESDFATYEGKIKDDQTICSYDFFRDVQEDGSGGKDALSTADDDRYEKEVVHDETSTTAGTHGIYLSMKDVAKTWGPKTPTSSHVFTVNEEGLYFLMYQVCQVDTGKKKNGTTSSSSAHLSAEIRSTFELDIHYKNYDVLGQVSYLTAGEMPLPTMFLYFSVSYALCFGLWVMNIRNIKMGHYDNLLFGGSKGGAGGGGTQTRRGGGRPVVHHIHHMMSILLLLKFLSILFESIRYHYIRLSGHAELWSAVYYIFAFLKGTFLFTVILLIGSGWSFVKPFLNDREKKIVFLVLVLQVIDNVAVVILTHETQGESLYDDWSAVLHMVDILCCCAVLIPIVWQVNSLESSIESSRGGDGNEEDGAADAENNTGGGGESGETTRTLTKLKLFRSFYLMVVAYIYFTRIVVYLFATVLGYRHTWMRYFLTELGTLAFYCTVGFLFRPMPDNPYLAVKNDDDAGGEGDDDDTALVGALEMGSTGNK